MKYYILLKVLAFIIVFSVIKQPVYAQDAQSKLTITGSNITLLRVFQQIKKQTGLTVFYNSQLLNDNDKVTVHFKGATLNDVLNHILEGRNISYELRRDKVIVLSKKSTLAVASAPKQGDTFLLKGKVTDENSRETLAGVSVSLKGQTNRATLTDKDGNFSIRVATADVLTFSYLGYDATDVAVSSIKNGAVKLKSRPSVLGEVVVIGYGEVKKADLTGAVGQVNVEDLQKAAVPTFDQALAGRVAGVQVSGNDGQPGVPNQIVIRGNNSLTQSNEPLYVIDGYPVESFEELPVSPSDIESIQILKDASATSIYGSRGANGVIIITTKKGLKGKPVIAVNSYYGVQNVTNLMSMMSPYEFVKYQYELNSGRTERLYLQDRTLEDYKNIEGHNMQKALYQTAPIFNTDIGFRGGNETTQYSVFTNIFRSDGIIINSGYNRVQGKLSLIQQLNKNIKAAINFGYTKTKTSGSIISENTGGIASLSKIYSALGYRPVAGIGDVDFSEDLYDPAVVDETPTDYRVNPVISSKNEINNRVMGSTVANGYIDFKLSKSFLLKVRGGVTENAFDAEQFYNSKTQKGNPNYPTSNGTTGSVYKRKTQNWLNENTLNYTTKIGNHRINALAGFTLQENSIFYSGYTANFIENESLGIDGIDASTSLIPSTYHEEWSLASFLGRINYDYKSKYLLTVNFRADGSSKFKGDNKWGYFPSGAFAWRVNKERFLRNIKQLSDLKLRIGYGVTGNNRVDEYATYSGVIFPYTASYSFNNGTPTRGASLRTSAGTTDLRWETTSQFNAGVDISLFKEQLNFVFDYYNKTTDDLLLNANLPYTTGYLTAFQNIGKVQNHGLEFTLQTQNIKRKNFSWNTSFNISFNRNKVLKLQDGQSYRLSTVTFSGGFTNVAPYIAKVGEPMGLIYGAVFNGLYQYDDFNKLSDGSYELKNEIPDNGNPRNSIKPGDMKFIDSSNDGTISSDDYTVIGNGNPLHVGGFMNDLKFGNFDLSIFLQWSYGNDIINANRLYFEQNVLNLYNFNLYSSVANRWSPDNQQTTIPRAGSTQPIVYHSNIVEDGSYLRLKTVSLGYNLPSEPLRKLNIKNLRAYLSVQNIFTLTGYSGSDPEVSVRNSALTPGFDWSAYPRARTFTLGLNASF